jgi:gliding motility-associated lipoprotein GldD
MKNSFYIILLTIAAMFSCQPNYVPKPHSYYRIDFPEREYRLFDSICPFTFEYPVYGVIKPDDHKNTEPCWLNINFPKYKGTIFLTYKEVDGNFDEFIEQNWYIIYKKIAQRADAVTPREYAYPEMNVYGAIYDISGNAASSTQFWATDSVKNFLRGSLYFNVRPNYDSLAPVISFFREDVVRLMESINWKDSNTKIK